MTLPERKCLQLSVSEALQKMLSSAQPIEETQNVEICESTGRVLAQNVYSLTDSPPFAQAEVDGIAFDYYTWKQNPTFKLIDTKALPKTQIIAECGLGEAIFVFTGAPMPKGTNCIQKLSLVQRDGNRVTILPEVSDGQNVRAKAAEISANQVIFEAGRRLGVADIGLLSSAGIYSVRVYRKVAVTLLSIGDGLRTVGVLGNDIGKGQKFDTNRYMLSALLASSQANLVETATISDDYAALTVMVQESAQKSDLILLSGAMSEENINYMKRILKEQYKISTWQIKLQKSKSLIFGRLDSKNGHQTLFCGLPSQPALSLMSFYQLVMPMLHCLTGLETEEPLRFSAVLSQGYDIKKVKSPYLRGLCQANELGDLFVSPHRNQDELTLSSFSESNCFIVLSQGTASLNKGDRVWVEYFPDSLR